MSLIVGRGGSLLLAMVGTWVVTTSVVKSQLSGGQNSKNLPRFTDSRLTPTVLPLFLDVSLFHHLWQKSFGFSRWGALQGVQLQKILQISEKLPEMSENPPTVEALACSPSY